MTDPTTAVPLTADEQAQLAALQARAAAAAQADADAAIQAVKDLVASPEFKAGRTAMDAAHAIARKDMELGYAVDMMDRLAKRYPTA